MGLIDAEHAGHEFFDVDGHLYLTVTCGTTAVFDLTVELSPEERDEYAGRGIPFVRELADRVRCYPSEFQDRHTPGVHP